ncbi:MAG: helix-turn-helix domain-containing protein [Desulfovibrio sp.]|nr:helix-turn-helix domain-containing protein [Desulfovibrio sp.]
MTLEEFGASLRAERERKGISLDEVSNRLKINVRMLRALEEGDSDHFPHAAYAKGFIRSYAGFLGLSAEEINEVLATIPSFAQKSDFVRVVESQPMDSQTSSGFLQVLILLVILGLLGGGGYYAWKSGVISQAYTWVMEKAQSLNNVTVPKNREAEKSAPLSASLPDEPLLRRTPERDVKSEPEKPSVPQQALPEKQPEPEKPVIMPEKAPADAKQVVIVATEPCWIHSTADGTDTRQFSLRKGDTFALTFKENLEVKLGNAGGVSFRYNGEDLPPVGKPGQVKTIVFPSKDVQ